MRETRIGTGTRIEGTLSGTDRLVVLGEVQGRIEGGAVVVEHGARVQAEVEAAQVTVAGVVQGRVTGREKVEILPDARMIGDVRTARILISDGAVFKGRVDMDVGEG
jgi:cytoskeletal protein CcmA (bactofilin family)